MVQKENSKIFLSMMLIRLNKSYFSRIKLLYYLMIL